MRMIYVLIVSPNPATKVDFRDSATSSCFYRFDVFSNPDEASRCCKSVIYQVLVVFNHQLGKYLVADCRAGGSIPLQLNWFEVVQQGLNAGRLADSSGVLTCGNWSVPFSHDDALTPADLVTAINELCSSV